MAAEAAADDYSNLYPRVLLGNINRGNVNSLFMVGVIESMLDRTIVSVVMSESGPYLDAGRNRMIAGAIDSATPWDVLLIVDSDIEFGPQRIRDLFAPTLDPRWDWDATPVLGGIYVNPFPDVVPGEHPDPTRPNDGQVGPVVYEWVERSDLAGELHGIPTFTFRRLSRDHLLKTPPYIMDNADLFMPSPDICEVACVGTGFLAIHRDLFAKMAATYGEPLPWFDEPIRDSIHYGEDMGFCLRVRDMGYPVLVNRACTVLHHKSIKLF